MRLTHQRTDNRRVIDRLAVLGFVGVAAMALAGCYERVVSARGFGADQYQVSEPYQENSKVDDWVFGERPSGRNNTKLKNMSGGPTSN